jgi:hypothetical protein
MTTSVEIEAIVRRVLAGMLAGGAPSPAGSTNGAIDSTSILRLHGKLITLASLPSSLAGVREVHVPTRAVVTPAVQDHLRSARIVLGRSGSSASSPNADATSATSNAVSLPSLQPLIVAGSASFMPTIKKTVCSRQAKTLQPSLDDASALGEAATGLRSGHRAAVIIGSSAHAIAWQAARDEKLRPVVVSQWSELAEAIAEVPTNLVILSTKYWNAPAASNVIRAFYKHVTQS